MVKNFAVIGEAAGSIPSSVAAAHPEIPWRLMADMRNVVVHQYFGIDAGILWQTARNDLPPLIAPLTEVLKSAG